MSEEPSNKEEPSFLATATIVLGLSLTAVWAAMLGFGLVYLIGSVI